MAKVGGELRLVGANISAGRVRGFLFSRSGGGTGARPHAEKAGEEGPMAASVSVGMGMGVCVGNRYRTGLGLVSVTLSSAGSCKRMHTY